MREMVGVLFVTHGKLRPYACMVMVLKREKRRGRPVWPPMSTFPLILSANDSPVWAQGCQDIVTQRSSKYTEPSPS